MSTEGGPTSENAALTKEVDALEQRVNALVAAIRGGKRVRVYLLLLVLALLVGLGFYFYQRTTRFMKEIQSQEMVDAVTARIEGNLAELFEREVRELAEAAAPKVSEAFMEQAKKDTPVIMKALEQERDVFAENLESRVRKRIEERHHELLQEHRNILADEFPQLKDDAVMTQMIDNFEIGLDKMVKEHYGDEIKQQMQQLYKTWEDFPLADEPAEGDQELADQLVGHLFELFKLVLIESDKQTIGADIQ